MTDRDNSPKSFLERWSRKKIEGEREASDPPAEPRATDVSLPDEPGAPASRRTLPRRRSKPRRSPSSISRVCRRSTRSQRRPTSAPSSGRACRRNSPVRPFAARGRPTRRFVTSRDSPRTTGTSPIRPQCLGSVRSRRGPISRRLVAQIFGDEEKPTDADVGAGQPADPQPPQIAKEITAPNSQADSRIPGRRAAESAPQNTSASERQVAQNDFVQRDNNTASHNSISGDETEEHTRRRQHGTALPQ